jgi:hypothetical protein
MADKAKHFVFSARTTGDGLRMLNELKSKLACSWDDLVIDAVNAHHGVEVPKVPRKERAPRAEKPKRERPPKKGKGPKNRKG